MGVVLESVELAPGDLSVSYIISANWRLDFLKPDVLTLARLLAMTSRFICWASMPLAEVQSARIMVSFLGFFYRKEASRLRVGPQIGDKLILGVIHGLDRFRVGFINSRRLNHVGHFQNRIAVALFDTALNDAIIRG